MESPAKEDAGGELAMEIESSVMAEDWRRALSRVVPSVVVLRTTAPRAFDTEVAGASYATGFVVDKSRGIILTNRHVVKPGRNGYLQHPFSRTLAVRSCDLWMICLLLFLVRCSR
jgi:S1-C subfamily serine protease